MPPRIVKRGAAASGSKRGGRAARGDSKNQNQQPEAVVEEGTIIQEKPVSQEKLNLDDGGSKSDVKSLSSLKNFLKTDVSKPSKKGGAGLSGRTSKKQQAGSGVNAKKNKASVFGGGANAASVKSSSGNRKALSDISNVPKGSQISQTVKKSSKRPLSVVQEDEQPMDWDEDEDVFMEGFRHNHDECIKAQTQSRRMDWDKFLELENDGSKHFHTQPASQVQIEDSPKRHYDRLMEEDETWAFEFPTYRGLHSSPCSSLASPKSDSSWLDNDHGFLNLQLMASPLLLLSRCVVGESGMDGH